MNRRVFYFAVAMCGLLLLGCNDIRKDSILDVNVDINKVMNLPYSQLSPDEQKAKLEQESIDFLNECNAIKDLSTIKTIEYLAELFDISNPDIPDPHTEVSSVKEIFDLTGVYGVYTWNASSRKWTQSNSSTELKFVFPAKKGVTSNNASLSVKTENSGVTFTESWWDYEYEGGQWNEVKRETVYYLPKSATGVLTIDNKEAAKIDFGAEYKDKKEVPATAVYKMNADGYEYWWKVEKAKESKVSMKFSHNNKSLLEGMAKSGAKVDEIVDLVKEDDYDYDDIYNRLGKADAYLKLMNNLMVVYTVDVEKYAKELDAIYEWEDNKWEDIDWNTSSYWTQYGQLHKERAEKDAKAFNDFMKASLVSFKDNYKIADLVAKSEKTGERWDNYQWNSTYNYWDWSWHFSEIKLYDIYEVNIYLKFGDGSLIEASVYFGEGFNELERKWEEFIDAFDW